MDMPEGKKRRSTLRQDARFVIDCDAGWHARMAARRISRHFDRWLAPAGLTSVQFTLMSLIASAPDDTMGSLAEAADIDQSTLTRNIETLEKAGWVEIVTAEKDRRRRAVWLTETGARLLESAMPCWRNATAALEAALGRDPIANLSLVAKKLD